MPRKARVTSPNAIYHISSRSISEAPLFRTDEDKEYFLRLIKRFKEYYVCHIYAYCLMTTHFHLHVGGLGNQVSKFMHSLNTAYVRYYNKKYSRRGSLFQERFFSRILMNDAQNLIVSAYIHNNPKDIAEYSDRVEYYPYSSYGIYLQIRKDDMGIIDKNFIYELFSPKNSEDFINKYFEFVKERNGEQRTDISNIVSAKILYASQDDCENPEETQKAVYEYYSGRRTILRDLAPENVISLILKHFSCAGENFDSNMSLAFKYKAIEIRSLCAYALRVLCGLTYKEICEKLHNITISGCAVLCNKGRLLVNEIAHYRIMLENLCYQF